MSVHVACITSFASIPYTIIPRLIISSKVLRHWLRPPQVLALYAVMSGKPKSCNWAELHKMVSKFNRAETTSTRHLGPAAFAIYDWIPSQEPTPLLYGIDGPV